jgi:hypothetical protein
MPTPSLKSAVACLAITAIVLPFAGCGDDEPEKKADRSATQATLPHKEKWLPPGSKISGAQWMASRHLEEVKPVNDPDVQRIAATLDNANKLYRESERMIANRSVQLEGMLKDIGVNEPATDILDDLTRVAGEVGQTEGYGAISQHYFNLRSNNIGRGEALAELKSRYGARQ